MHVKDILKNMNQKKSWFILGKFFLNLVITYKWHYFGKSLKNINQTLFKYLKIF